MFWRMGGGMFDFEFRIFKFEFNFWGVYGSQFAGC